MRSRRFARAADAEDLPPLLWLYFPPLMLLVQYVTRFMDPDFYRTWIEPELGLVELATPALLVPAILCGIAATRRWQRYPAVWLGPWMLALTLGCIYFAGEELSWGQQLVHWDTPDLFRRLNDQGETNLHNMSSWLDQKPRAALKAFVIVGGIIMPLWQAATGRRYQPRFNWQYWFWPSRVCLPSAVLAVALSLPQYATKLTGWRLPFPFDIRASETIEYYYALFLALYLVSIWRRLDQL